MADNNNYSDDLYYNSFLFDSVFDVMGVFFDHEFTAEELTE
jgi:hypothetical protein